MCVHLMCMYTSPETSQARERNAHKSHGRRMSKREAHPTRETWMTSRPVDLCAEGTWRQPSATRPRPPPQHHQLPPNTNADMYHHVHHNCLPLSTCTPASSHLLCVCACVCECVHVCVCVLNSEILNYYGTRAAVGREVRHNSTRVLRLARYNVFCHPPL